MYVPYDLTGDFRINLITMKQQAGNEWNWGGV